MSKRKLPVWKIDQAEKATELKLYNSLTRKKEIFVPKDGKNVLWYSCGPTVYDSSHMGHARSYISFDILRRVLSGYFGFNVFYVMNITDIDDKIIKRARQNYLFAQYKNTKLEQILIDTKEALQFEVNKLKATNNAECNLLINKMLTTVTEAINTLEKAILQGNEETIKAATEALLLTAKDPLSDFLDHLKGAEVIDNSIFSELPQHWESEFHKDMDALNVLRPHVLTRVSEYIPEIIEYIQKIIENGMAYESNGSVYFDVAHFNASPNHYYAKLVPEAYGDTESLQSGEGELTDVGEKKSPNDFALWKASKPGEPWWPSPWSVGRPGWHIECSVMASAICGSTLDIHTGGVDLKFPHHDNEIAQAEAYFNNDLWVRYFLHSGHLTISGCKMSKSLKNFITISDALKKHSSRQLRLAFLLHSWKDTLDYGPNTMEMAINYEKILNEFFLTVKDLTQNLTEVSHNERFVKWDEQNLELHHIFIAMKSNIHAALCDNIDTRRTLDVIQAFISVCNSYIKKKSINLVLLQDIGVYITGIFCLFGVISEKPNLGFPVNDGGSGHDVESIVLPFAKIIGNFRDDVRSKARTIKAVDILKECDRLRDDILPNVGVRLEDREGEATAIKLINKDDLMKEKQAKQQAEEEKAHKKKELEANQQAKEAQKRMKPSEMFLSMTDKYSAFNSEGFPTHDAEGNKLTNKQTKKLQKLYNTQKQKYESYLACQT